MSSQTIDSRGRRCPLPIIDLAAAARDAPPGTLLTLISDDPAAAADVAAWCRLRGQDYEGSEAFDAAGPPGSAPATSYHVRIRGAANPEAVENSA